ncbi:unnamed protein product, partial [marine sediment metagenome]
KKEMKYLKKIRNTLKKNKDNSLLFTDLKKIKCNKNYLNYILNFKQHILNPKEDVEERVYDVVNYLRNSEDIIANITKKKIKNGSIVLSDNSLIVKEILNKAKLEGKKFEVYNLKTNLIEKADLILMGKNIKSNIFKFARQHDVPVFFCTNSLKTNKINNGFTGIISELGIYKPHVFEEIKK